MYESTSSEWGVKLGGVGCTLRVRTGPECHEDNLRELTWDSNPNCGIAREKKRKKERELSCEKLKGISWPAHRTEDWANTTGELAGYRPAHPMATARARRQGAIWAPEMASSTKLWAGPQLLTKSSWDPGWLTSTRRVTVRDQFLRGDTWHTWDGALAAHPGNHAAGTGEVIRCTAHLGACAHQASGRLRCSDLGRAQNTGPIESAFVEYPRTWTWVA